MRILSWFRHKALERKYARLNKELARQGSTDRWVELAPGDWRYVSSIRLEKPIPPLRPAKKVVIAGETFYVRRMASWTWTPLGVEVPPAERGLTIISGKDLKDLEK
jgi:hypothetical protein